MRTMDRCADGTWNKALSFVHCLLSLVPRPSSIIHTYLKRSKFLECKVAKISCSGWFKGSLFHNQ
jgi:hypothetical protein